MTCLFLALMSCLFDAVLVVGSKTQSEMRTTKALMDLGTGADEAAGIPGRDKTEGRAQAMITIAETQRTTSATYVDAGSGTNTCPTGYEHFSGAECVDAVHQFYPTATDGTEGGTKTLSRVNWPYGCVYKNTYNYIHINTYAGGAGEDHLNLICKATTDTAATTASAATTDTAATTNTAATTDTAATTVTDMAATTDTASATGDPHLVNVNNERFDIHDGVHRLIHYPHHASETEALLKVDIAAEMMGRSCYSVFIKSARISGKWIGDDIVLGSSNLSGHEAFGLNVGGSSRWLDWSSLKARSSAGTNLTRTMPVRITAGDRRAIANLPGGESIDVAIGREHPIVLEFWSSHGSNELTLDKDVQYLNLQAKNLPKDIGGILGLDKYVKPERSQCGLVQDETNLLNYISNMALLQWQVSAHVSN